MSTIQKKNLHIINPMLTELHVEKIKENINFVYNLTVKSKMCKYLMLESAYKIIHHALLVK